MPASNSSWILLFLLPYMVQASSCNGCDRSLLVRHKLMNKKHSIFVIPGMPDSCSTFMTESEADAAEAQVKAASKKLADATAVTATRTLIASLGGAMKLGGALASVGGGFYFGMVSSFILPDPQAERIKRLEQGLDCAFKALEILHKDIQNLDEELEKTRHMSVLGQSKSLRDMVTNLKNLAKDHHDCAKLMKCVADVKKLNDARFSAASCEQLLLAKDKIWSKVEDCDAKAFRQKFVQNNEYNFVDSDMTHVEEVIKSIISENWEDQYKTAHSLVVEYADVATAFYSAWTAMEEWAGAICQPWGSEAVITKSSCTAADADDVKRGLGQFSESYYTPFASKIARFLLSMSTDDFKKQRKNSVISYKVPQTFSCRIELSKTNTKTFNEGNGRFNGWTATRSQDQYDLKCDTERMWEKIVEKVCMGSSCEYVEQPPMPPFGCKNKACDFDGCSTRFSNNCPDCGYVDCDHDWPVQVKYDHLKESLKVFGRAFELVYRRNMTKPPPYRLAPNTTYFLEYDLRPGGSVPPPPTTTS